jgi:hypothetical protein
MEGRGLKLRLYAFAFIISLLMFAVGIVLGWQWGYSAVSQMSSELSALSSEETGMETLALMENQSFACPIFDSEFARLFQKTLDYGDRLQALENKNGKLDPQVMELKKDYSAMQLRNYLLQQRMDAQCGTAHNTIIYFYSNEGYSAATDEGIQIGLVGARYEAYTYHFDVNVDSPLVNGLKAGYGVAETPTLVINGEKHSGFMTAAEIEAALERTRA